MEFPQPQASTSISGGNSKVVIDYGMWENSKLDFVQLCETLMIMLSN